MPGTVLKTLNVLLLFTVRIILWDNLNFSSFNGWENWSKVHYIAQGKVYNDMQKYLGSFRSGSPEKGFWNYVGIEGSHEGKHQKGNRVQIWCKPCVVTWKVSADPAGSSGAGVALQKGPALESCGWAFILLQWRWMLLSGWVWKEVWFWQACLLWQRIFPWGCLSWAPQPANPSSIWENQCLNPEGGSGWYTQHMKW